MMGIIAPTKSKNGKLITREHTARNAVEHDSTGTLAVALHTIPMALMWVTLYLVPTIDDDVHLLEAVAAAAMTATEGTIL
jgi:hypothetical protein